MMMAPVMMVGMDFDEIADELYAAAPEDFVALRKQRAAEAKAAGDRELSKRITALRRPTRSAWIVNLLAGQATDDLTGLLDLGAALAEAQQRLSGPDLRSLSRQRHAAISALVRRGAQLAEVRGHTPTEATLREVSSTLQAALADPQVAEQVRLGRLSQPQEYSGFGPELLAPAPPTGDHGGAAGRRSSPASPDRDRDHDRQDADRSDTDRGTTDEDEERARAEAEHERLLQELSSAQTHLDRLRAQLDRARERRDAAAQTAERRATRVRELEDQLERARQEAARADAQLDEASTALADLEADQERAEAAVSDALSALAGSD